MKMSLFTQSLFALSLEEAITAAARVGYPAIELACASPHFDRAMAEAQAPERVARIAEAGLAVSALSLFNRFTSRDTLDEEIQTARTFLACAPLFNTDIVKITPGPPGSADAGEEHWKALEGALRELIPVARDAGVRLAIETHMRQLTDTLASTVRLLDVVDDPVLGVTVDFSNLAFAGDDPVAAIHTLAPRLYNAHVKNGYIDSEGTWRFTPLDQGLTDYAAVLPALRAVGYDGYLTVECLGEDAASAPVMTARRDHDTLANWLRELR